MELYFVSSNEGKIIEAQHILGFPLKIAKLSLHEIQSLDVEEIVRIKAEDAYRQIQQPLLVDDAGMYIEAWNGFPGPFIKFVSDAGGPDLLLQMMRSETNRKAYFQASIGYHDGKDIHIFSGKVFGHVTDEKRGENGWGFDPVFQPDGHTLTLSEMTLEDKNKISHRKFALEQLRSFLQSH